LSAQLFSSLKKDGVADLEDWLREQMEPEPVLVDEAGASPAEHGPEG
jgi:hypothetical protein